MHSTEEKKKKRTTNKTVGDKKESQAIDNRFTTRIMLEQKKQTGCYLTEEERMKLVAHGTPFWERRSQAAWLGSVLWCVYNVQGGYRETGYDRGLAPELWMPSQTGRPWTTGALSSSRSLSRGFDELHARTPPSTSNTADGSRCTQLAGVPPVAVMYGRPRARCPARLGRRNWPAHHQSKRGKPKLGQTDEWPRHHIHRATWLACLINRRCQRPQVGGCDAP